MFSLNIKKGSSIRIKGRELINPLNWESEEEMIDDIERDIKPIRGDWKVAEIEIDLCDEWEGNEEVDDKLFNFFEEIREKVEEKYLN